MMYFFRVEKEKKGFYYNFIHIPVKDIANLANLWNLELVIFFQPRFQKIMLKIQ
jgi:hypothetical protein